MAKEQSLLSKIMSLFEGENIQTQYSVLSCRIYELAMKIDIKDLCRGDTGYEIEKQKAIEEKLDSELIGLNNGKFIMYSYSYQ